MVGIRWIIFVLLLLGPVSSGAGLIVNEVLVNEPQGHQVLEWIELYADTGQVVTLSDYQLMVGQTAVPLPSGVTIAPHTYQVLCRRLVGAEGEQSFERWWGDNSGQWGDCASEQALQVPLEAALRLKNDSGSISLFSGGQLESYLFWPSAGEDGISWERVTPLINTAQASRETAGATPGTLNSATPVAHDLAITDARATVDYGWTVVAVTVSNRGTESSAATTLTLYYDATPTHLKQRLPALSSGQEVTSEFEISLSGLRQRLTVWIPQDQRPQNDSLGFWAPGYDFPPVILSEFLANPVEDSRAEWVELLSVHHEPVDIVGWFLGDARTQTILTDTTVLIWPDQRLVLARDRAAFLSLYPDYDDLLLLLPSWPALNNSTDTVRLLDSFDLEADRFEYTEVFTDDRTWSRDETGGEWRQAVDRGGTPGTANRVLHVGGSPVLTVTVSPEIISPDGDGRADSTVISISAPTMTGLKLRLYDRQGRRVRSFDTDSQLGNEYVWRGETDGGSPLPIGVYILYCETSDGSVKLPVVIARQ